MAAVGVNAIDRDTRNVTRICFGRDPVVAIIDVAVHDGDIA